MQVQASNVVEKFATKPPTRKERQIKKLKETMMKEDRIVWDNIDEKTAALCKAMRIFVDANPRLMGENAEEARDKYFECVALAQYKSLKKGKLLQPKKPKEAKIVKPKPPKVLKPKAVKEIKRKVVEQLATSEPRIDEKSYSLLLQELQALTDQELVAKFVLNQYIWQKEPKEFWCTICEKKFERPDRLTRHFKIHETSTTTSEESPSPVLSASSPERPTSPASALTSPEATIVLDSSLLPQELMSIDLTEDDEA